MRLAGTAIQPKAAHPVQKDFTVLEVCETEVRLALIHYRDSPVVSTKSRLLPRTPAWCAWAPAATASPMTLRLARQDECLRRGIAVSRNGEVAASHRRCLGRNQKIYDR